MLLSCPLSSAPPYYHSPSPTHHMEPWENNLFLFFFHFSLPAFLGPTQSPVGLHDL